MKIGIKIFSLILKDVTQIIGFYLKFILLEVDHLLKNTPTSVQSRKWGSEEIVEEENLELSEEVKEEPKKESSWTSSWW